MGGCNKLLLPLLGEPVIRRTARAVLAAGPEEVVVVSGHAADALAPALDGLALRVHRHAGYAQGQMSSVCAGIAALERGTDAVLICLGDMALLEPADYAALVAAYAAQSEQSIVVPLHEGRRGNPVLVAEWRIPEILAGRLNLGCRKLIEDHPDDVLPYAAAHDRYLVDIDTPQAYEAVQRRLAADGTRQEPGA